MKLMSHTMKLCERVIEWILRNGSYLLPIQFYAWDVDHEIDLLTMTCDGVIYRTNLFALSFNSFGEGESQSAQRDFVESTKEEISQLTFIPTIKGYV